MHSPFATHLYSSLAEVSEALKPFGVTLGNERLFGIADGQPLDESPCAIAALIGIVDVSRCLKDDTESCRRLLGPLSIEIVAKQQSLCLSGR